MDAFRQGPHGVALTIMGAGRSEGAGTLSRLDLNTTSGTAKVDGSKSRSSASPTNLVEPESGVANPPVVRGGAGTTRPDETSGATVVERLEEAEQRFGIRLQGLNTRIDGNWKRFQETVEAMHDIASQAEAVLAAQERTVRDGPDRPPPSRRPPGKSRATR